jgi:tetratricopeptide (TPR) repeat protein
VDNEPDCKEGWAKIQSENYDLVVLNWDLKDTEALGLYNRIRSIAKYRFLPIIVMSNVIKVREFKLFDEDLSIAAIEKPVQETKFNEVLASLSLSKVMTTEFLPLLSKIVKAAIAENSLASLINDLKDSKQILFNSLKICGDAFFSEKDYVNAELAYFSAWNLGDRRLSLTTGLAKTYFLTKKHDQARKLLRMSEVIAPGSIERLGLLGEVELALNNPQEASHAFESVLKIDPASKKAQAGMNIAEKFRNFEGGNHGMGFASYLNIVGIGLAQSGKTQDALYYYKSAMLFVHDPESLAKLWFNLGISLMRMGSKQSAQDAFNKSARISDRLSDKVTKYLKNLDTAKAVEEDFGHEKI